MENKKDVFFNISVKNIDSKEIKADYKSNFDNIGIEIKRRNKIPLKNIILKSKLTNIQEIEALLKYIQKIEKEYSCYCTLLELEIKC